jgi:hypothetical protein
VVCVGCGWLGLRAAYPFVTAAQWRADNDRLERQLLRYKLQNQRDRLEIEKLQTPEGLEQRARERGWVKPNELRLIVPSD